MSKVTTSKTKKNTKKLSARGLGGLLERTQGLLASMVAAMETELKKADDETRYAVLFGTRGLAAQMPKLMQLASQLAALQLELGQGNAEEEAYPPISDADLKLLKDWLES